MARVDQHPMHKATNVDPQIRTASLQNLGFVCEEPKPSELNDGLKILVI
jgi:hypothetical protein